MTRIKDEICSSVDTGDAIEYLNKDGSIIYIYEKRTGKETYNLQHLTMYYNDYKFNFNKGDTL